jgi:hypothetical protein
MDRKPIIICFLDIDGVLNNEKVLSCAGEELDPECVKLVEVLVQETGANIVITSAWRLSHSLISIQHHFKRLGFAYPERIIGATSDLSAQSRGGVWVSEPRGMEINLWLKQIPVDAFVILDDDSDMRPVQDKLVQTSFRTGLTRKHVDRAKQIIKEQLEVK